jgi:hypothetical protein
MVYLPPEIMDIIFQFHNPYLGIKQKLEKAYELVKKRKLQLNYAGIFTKKTKTYFFENISENPITSVDYKNIARCIEELPEIFEHQKGRTINSYHGKHLVEKYIGYISNGQFIAAIIIAEYKFKKYKIDGNPNCNIYFKEKIT